MPEHPSQEKKRVEDLLGSIEPMEEPYPEIVENYRNGSLWGSIKLLGITRDGIKENGHIRRYYVFEAHKYNEDDGEPYIVTLVAPKEKR